MRLCNITNGRLSFLFLKQTSLKLKSEQKNQEPESHQPLLAVVWDFYILCLFRKLILSDPAWVRGGSINHCTILIAGIACNYYPVILIFFSFMGVQISVTNYFIFFSKIRPAKSEKRRWAGELIHTQIHQICIICKLFKVFSCFSWLIQKYHHAPSNIRPLQETR